MNMVVEFTQLLIPVLAEIPPVQVIPTISGLISTLTQLNKSRTVPLHTSCTFLPINQRSQFLLLAFNGNID